jgi:transcriptional regulator with XRE-family HTH domain
MRYIRKKRGISLNDLGKKIGFDRQTIARFELEGGASFELVLSLMHYFKLDEILDEIKKPLRKNKKLMEKFPV